MLASHYMREGVSDEEIKSIMDGGYDNHPITNKSLDEQLIDWGYEY